MIYWSVITIFLKYLFTPLAIFHYPSQPPFPTPLSIFYTCQPQPFACHCQVKLPVIYGRDSPQMANYTKTFPATISGRPPRPPFTPPLGHLINLPSFRRPLEWRHLLSVGVSENRPWRSVRNMRPWKRN